MGFTSPVNDGPFRKSGLRGFFRCDEVEKTQEYFVYFKVLRQDRSVKKTARRRSGHGSAFTAKKGT